MVNRKKPDQENLPTPHQTLNRWFMSKDKVADLHNIVSSNTFKVAVAVLKEVTRPSFKSISFKSLEENNTRQAWYAGYCDALADLEKLGSAPTAKSPVEAQEWTHIDL
jgi:hypothetical protein